ncbi:hypothetical protein [Plantactinospora soyae]|uniref:Uncharacterized protein n=1 Tax=Plantactinospora soyae TaxID=1544732 RepID=A0A927M7S0_9ACTN|nr:hypothetical protein [Plantactinospora soyae]MBE1486055.1 hypothetical protein [Plantactinospora soyae]
MATRLLRIAYLVVYFVMLGIGLAFKIPVWTGLLIGVLAMLPIAVADWVISSRRKGREAS